MVTTYFAGRKLVIATRHQKERVIAPIIKQSLGVEIIVPADLDTDQFGTFSGEVARTVDPAEAARRKCRLACRQYDCSLAIANEGSFGPHPALLFVPADEEIIVLLDLENGLEINARELSTKTNFAGSLFHSWEAAKQFASAVLFPGHALIVKEAKDKVANMVKGVSHWEELEKTVMEFLERSGQVFIETDMRAQYNPTRMEVIESATRKLVDNIMNGCPHCHTPGFNVVEVVSGLPCSQCGAPTKSTLKLIYACQCCQYREEKIYPNEKREESPVYCDWCNP